MIASRVLKCKTDNGLVDVPVRLYAPEQVDGAWRCLYEIAWPDGTWSSVGWGVDAVQALLLALQKIGVELYTSEYHERGELYWTEPGQGFGFPVVDAMRNLLVGEDRAEV
jgi:Domain of unknown function (DUF6968)